MRVEREDTGAVVELTRSKFILEGGEGAVYRDGDFAIKVYKDPDQSISVGKIAALAPLACESILAPLAPVTLRSSPVGYVMKLAKRCLPLSRVLPRGWRSANGFGDAMAAVMQLRSLFERIHAGGALVIDPNDANFLMREDFSGLVAIDVDSYATANYPATAIQPIVRDPSSADFSKSSDWYGFALLAFALLVGAHPFKGSMPGYGRKADEIIRRMTEGASALRAGAKLPPTCFPLDVIPGAWYNWFETVFHSSDRPLPPVSCFVRKTIAAGFPRGTEVIFERLRDLPVKLPISPGFVIVEGSEFRADAVSSIDGRFHILSAGRISEIERKATLGRAIARHIGDVSRHSTTLFPGVAIQYLIGSCFASIFSRPRRCAQVRLREIEGAKLIDAKFAGGCGKPGKTGVLRVAVDRGGQIEIHNWCGLLPGKFAHHWLEMADAASIEAAELDTGVIAISTSEGAELFRADQPKNRRSVRSARLATGIYSSGAGTLLVDLADGVYSAKLR